MEWNNVYSAPVYYRSDQGPAQYFYPQPQCESNCDIEQTKSYFYDVKIINPKKNSDFVVRRWHDNITEVFQTPTILQVKLRESFPEDVPVGTDLKLGYLQGSQKCWIFEERDLQEMYELYTPGSKITLWCNGRSDANPEPSSKEGRQMELLCRLPPTVHLRLRMMWTKYSRI